MLGTEVVRKVAATYKNLFQYSNEVFVFEIVSSFYVLEDV